MAIVYSETIWIVEYSVTYDGQLLSLKDMPKGLLDLTSAERALTSLTGRLYKLANPYLNGLFELRRGFNCYLDQELKHSDFLAFEGAILAVYNEMCK